MTTVNGEYQKTWLACAILSHPDRNRDDRTRDGQCRAAIFLCNVADRSSNQRLRRLALAKLVEVADELGYDLLLSSERDRCFGLTRLSATLDNPTDYEVRTARQ